MNPNFPPPKTDKPRPHICVTCTRSFARLEHLKRHERSHTKEKPFACNECTRCFARRDLLLRHQQKLHLTAPPSSRSRRRESTSSTAPNGSTRVRKNSVANSTGSANGNMRPRANTISHVDNSTLGMIAAANSSLSRPDMNYGFGQSNVNGLPGVSNHHYRGMSSANGHHGNPHVLPKLETKNRHMNVSASMRTAPPGGFGDTDMENMLFGPGSTINPAQLHFCNSPQTFGFEAPSSPFHQSFSGFPHGHGSLDGEGNFPWLSSFDQQMSFNNEQAIDNSSPSAVDSASPGAMSEMMLDGSNSATTSAGWRNPMMSQAPFGQAYPVDLSTQPFTDFYTAGPISPKSSGMQMGEHVFSTPPMPPQTPHSIFGGNHFYHPGAQPDTASNSAASISSSNRQSSVTSVSTDSITDATRQALLNSLSESYGHGHGYLKTSQPQMSSPLSSGLSGGRALPSTSDLQRYVTAYIRYFHPHLPFLHVASLSFDAPAFTSNLTSCGPPTFGQANVTGGGGALILAMAAIGALYEFEVAASRDLFEYAKTMIQLYLHERRKADMSAAANSNGCKMDVQNTPLWLVQAMLLNVIYGHNCGDKKAAAIANTHCAALVSLARGAGLVRPTQTDQSHDFHPLKQEDLQMTNDETSAWSGFISHPALDLENEWHAWKVAEERKRSLYAIFILSSLLVSAYNCAPALMNSEILLDLPCDERLWAAESAEIWRSHGGTATADQSAPSFAAALSSLLTAGQRRQQRQHHMSPSHDSSGLKLESLAESDIRPSTFGCLVLINAMHNYIWETRQRHADRQWTAQETEAMHAHIEPALRAWQAAWSSNPDHSLERPNPFGVSSLSADCIPLLDLAYVRLFVNLSTAKQSFFQREYHAMAEELAHGSEIVQHAEHSPSPSPRVGASKTTSTTREASESIMIESDRSTTAPNGEAGPNQCSAKCSNRERQLRKAAYCAANSLMMSDRLSVTFADYNSRELPLQSALCAFDCAQILAEWVSTVQQRVGRYVGILGKDDIDYSQAPACMFLEEDDCKLLEKTSEIVKNAETKLGDVVSLDTMIAMAETNGPDLENSGYGSKILSVHARMFEREATWPSKPELPQPVDLILTDSPVCREMAYALRTQAAHIREKAEKSITAI